MDRYRSSFIPLSVLSRFARMGAMPLSAAKMKSATSGLHRPGPDGSIGAKTAKYEPKSRKSDLQFRKPAYH